MNKLLAANFMRLKKSKVFWGAAVFMAMIGFIFAILQKRTLDQGFEATLEGGAFQYVAFIGFVTAVFCAVFVGTEYSDGTLRNKIIVGHKRSEIYLSTFIVCALTAAAVCILCMVCYLGLGAALLGGFASSLAAILPAAVCVIALSTCFSAIFTLIALLCHNKAASAVLCILLALILLFAGSFLLSILDEPEFYGGYYMDETGELRQEEMQPNPRYVSGTTRKVYEVLLDVTPGGQQLQLAPGDVEKPWMLTVYSIGLAALATACGMVFFKKKDLK